MDEYVSVSVRIKPTLNKDSTNSSCLQVISKSPNVLLVVDRPQTYHFDNIFTDEDNQQTVYDETVRDFVENVKNGYNCTVFAYGQTGTGKTYTMGTNPEVSSDESVGIILRTLRDFFDTVIECEDAEIGIFISFLEIYNEKVFDLLNDNKTPLPLKGFTVQGLMKEQVFSSYEAQQLLKIGSRNRHTGETKQNNNSSRSHSVFTIYCNVKHSDHETTAKLNLVDLAGSESVKKTGNRGSTFQEGININKGLLCIGQVMAALSSTNSQFVPYRRSTITTILHDSLNVNNYVSLIACISSNPEDVSETIQTLEFAQRVKRLRNKPEVNKFISKYKRNNPELFLIPSLMTPSKRPHLGSLQTPLKRTKNLNAPMTSIQESTNNTIENNFSMEKMSFFGSTESVFNDVGTQSFSPIVRKYVNAMENNIMEKLETVINSLKTPVKDKENSPNWDKIQFTIGKMVRSEIIQFSAKASTATSSPLQEHNFAPRLLNYSNTDDSIEKDDMRLAEVLDDKENSEAVFKMPILPVKKKPKRKNNKEIAEKENLNEVSEETFKIPTLPVSQPRRSLRLRQRNMEEENSFYFEMDSLFIKPNSPARKRKSVRLQLKSELIKPKTVGETKPNNKNTIKERTKRTLNILNNGSLNDIEKLHTVGKKTAERIHIFRQLNGKFRKISQLQGIPQWSSVRYQKFLIANFLADD